MLSDIPAKHPDEAAIPFPRGKKRPEHIEPVLSCKARA
jgi:hypothetical protein